MYIRYNITLAEVCQEVNVLYDIILKWLWEIVSVLTNSWLSGDKVAFLTEAGARK